jgi:hypothetical protein
LHADKTLHYQHLELFWESCETLKCCFWKRKSSVRMSYTHIDCLRHVIVFFYQDMMLLLNASFFSSSFSWRNMPPGSINGA